jgi:hypothetical protein
VSITKEHQGFEHNMLGGKRSVLVWMRVAVRRRIDGAVVEDPRCRAPHHGLIPGAAW